VCRRLSQISARRDFIPSPCRSHPVSLYMKSIRVNGMWNEIEWQTIIAQTDEVEFDWYGVDRLGHVAVFCSYGRGVIPQAVKVCRDTYNALYHFMEALSEVTDAHLVYGGAGRYDDWIHYSKRGLFGYDYQDAHRSAPLGQYDLLTVPLKPVGLSDLGVPKVLLPIIPLVDVEFGAAKFLPFSKFPS
jgi:hypothetical protein